LNAGDRAQQLNGLLERGDLLPDRLGQRLDLLVQEIKVVEDRADPDGVQLIEATLQGLPQCRELRAQPALGEIGEHLGVGGAGHERVEHQPAGDTENVRFSSSSGGESSVRKADLDARAAEVDHGDQGVCGVKAVGAV